MNASSLFKRKEVPKPLNEALLGKVKEILSKQLGVEEAKINLDSKIIDDLGADSLDTVELVMALEEEFDTEIPDEDAEKIQTVREMLEYLDARIRKKGTQ